VQDSEVVDGELGRSCVTGERRLIFTAVCQRATLDITDLPRICLNWVTPFIPATNTRWGTTHLQIMTTAGQWETFIHAWAASTRQSIGCSTTL